MQPGEDTCANTPSVPMLRTLVLLASLQRWEVASWDVSTAFLYAQLEKIFNTFSNVFRKYFIMHSITYLIIHSTFIQSLIEDLVKSIHHLLITYSIICLIIRLIIVLIIYLIICSRYLSFIQSFVYSFINYSLIHLFILVLAQKKKLWAKWPKMGFLRRATLTTNFRANAPPPPPPPPPSKTIEDLTCGPIVNNAIISQMLSEVNASVDH